MSSKNNGNHPAAKKQPETVIQITDSVIFTSPEKDPDKNKSSDTASQLNKINQFLDDNKVILGLIVTIGTILLSGAMYLYKKGYLSYFNIGAEWNDFADKSVFYLLALPFCIVILAIASLFALLYPYRYNARKTGKKIYYLVINLLCTYDFCVLIDRRFIPCYNQLSDCAHESTRKASLLSLILWVPFLLTLLVYIIFLSTMDYAKSKSNKGNKIKDDSQTEDAKKENAKYDKFPLIIAAMFLTIFIILSLLSDSNNNIEILKHLTIYSGLLSCLTVMDFFFYSFIKEIDFRREKAKQSVSTTKKSSLRTTVIMFFLILAIAGYTFYEIGQDMAELRTSFKIIYMSEQQESQPPDAEAIREIRELVTVTTSAAATTAPAQANGSTTTTTTVPQTPTAPAAPTASDVPDSAVVYVVLAENKDSYLAAMGKIEGDGAGGILRIDPDCRTVLEKGKQTTVTLTFREVTKDYVYAKEDAP